MQGCLFWLVVGALGALVILVSQWLGYDVPTGAVSFACLIAYLIYRASR